MPQPNSPHIQSTPAVPGQPYTATDAGHSSTAQFEEVMSGPCNLQTGAVGPEWGDSGEWKQT